MKLGTPSQSAANLLARARSTTTLRFSSGCATIDALLSPPTADESARLGLAQGSVLELLGPPGSGKTRTCLALVLNARFDAVQTGEECEVLVVDAEGTLTPQLITRTAVDFAGHNSHLPATVDEVRRGIHYHRVYDLLGLTAFFQALPEWLIANPLVKFVVLDSLSSHLRPTSLQVSTRNTALALIKSTLASVTSVHSVSVVLTSHLSIKLFSADGEPSKFQKSAEALLVPQLGDNWIGGQCWRIVLYYDRDGGRMAHLLAAHSPSKASRGAFYMDALGPCELPLE